MKKGNVEADVVALFVIVLMIALLVVSMQFLQRPLNEINTYKEKTNADFFLMNILRTQRNDGSMREIMVANYYADDFSATRYEMNSIIEEAFGEKLCWRLIIEEKIVEEAEDCIPFSERDIRVVDAKVRVPTEDNILEIRLQ